MQTLVLRIPDKLAAELAAEARRLKSTKSAVARARLSAHAEPVEIPKTGYDLIADLIGVETGGPVDVSARKKQYLTETGYGRDKRRR